MVRALKSLRLLCVAGAVGVATALFQPVTAEAATKPAKTVKAKKPAARQAAVKVKAARATKVVAKRRVALVNAEPPRVSFGQLYGLHGATDPLDLKSSVALVLDQDTNEVLFSKNSQAVLPIASITKLMTALVVAEANLPADEVLTITQDDVDTEKHSGSRLAVGTQLTRGEMMHLALMSSENRAANALGRHYPGGLQAFVAAMNLKAHQLGMNDTRYVEPTGLSSNNQSSAHDLAELVKEASKHEVIRQLSTSPEHRVEVGSRLLQFRNSNGLVRSGSWDIGLQKTGYISEAGRCLVMQAQVAGRKVIMVLLDSAGKYSRIGDAERIRKWVTTELPASLAVSTAVKSAP